MNVCLRQYPALVGGDGGNLPQLYCLPDPSLASNLRPCNPSSLLTPCRGSLDVLPYYREGTQTLCGIKDRFELVCSSARQTSARLNLPTYPWGDN